MVEANETAIIVSQEWPGNVQTRCISFLGSLNRPTDQTLSNTNTGDETTFWHSGGDVITVMAAISSVENNNPLLGHIL